MCARASACVNTHFSLSPHSYSQEDLQHSQRQVHPRECASRVVLHRRHVVQGQGKAKAPHEDPTDALQAKIWARQLPAWFAEAGGNQVLALVLVLRERAV